MNMAESYSVYLTTGSDVNRTGTVNESTYRVNWANLLPPKVQRFELAVTVRSNLTATTLIQVAIIEIDGLPIYNWSQTGSRSSVVTSIMPRLYGATQYGFESSLTDNASVMCDFPRNNTITVRWLISTGALYTSLPDHTILLNFTPVE